ncbi:universal stress protein [Thermogemmatispora onikobensis]|uniref:universal stress protein n=1 Tax=Thermogemmatispora onikobensis TaxID=732234 RepID=UPI000852CD2A|nr:universal stress protein [Thermogemmatispora onikobensis]
MFQRILAAVDGSETSLWAAEAAIELGRLSQAELHILSVEETPPHYVSTQEERTQEHLAAQAYYQQIHATLRRQATRRGLAVRTVITSGHEGQAILAYLEAERCDLLVLGAQGHSSVWGEALGSTADKIVSQTPCSVLIIRAKPQPPLFHQILIGLDGSALSWQAFRIGLQLAKGLAASLHIASVIEGPMRPPTKALGEAPAERLHWDWEAYITSLQALAEAEAHLAGVAIDSLARRGHASSVLVDLARALRIDLLIVGATGQEHPWSTTSGGTARRVANEASCAAMLVRPLILQRQVQHIMTQATTVTEETSLREIAHHLLEQQSKLLVVVDPTQRVRGVITLGSLLDQTGLLQQLDWRQISDGPQLAAALQQLLTANRVAREVMREPLVLREDTPIEIAARWLTAHQITRAPIVDAQGRLVGMLDQETILRYYADHLTDEAAVSARPERPLQKKRLQTVGEAPVTPVPAVTADTPFFELLRRIQETPLRRIIVVDEAGRAIGVIGDSDVLAAQRLPARRNPLLALAQRFGLAFPEEALQGRSKSLLARQVMRPRLFSVTPATRVTEAVRLLVAHRIKRLVVVDEQGAPLGLVDRQQLLQTLIAWKGEAD